jgi:hypothetical protein
VVINVTSDTDITGQARKMGRNAGLKNDGTLDSVHSVGGTEQTEGTIRARTMNPDMPDPKGLGNTERAKYNKTGNNY